MSNKRFCYDKTLTGLEIGAFDFITIQNITIQSPTSVPTYTLTLPPNDGNAGQVLSTNGSGVLSWINSTAGVTSVTATSPILSSGGFTPNISLSTVPTNLGGTGLTTVGTNGQVLTSNGSGTLSWTTPTTGTVTSVAATSPLASSGGTTPVISLSTVPTTLGGTGLTTVGTNGQVLTSNGTSLTWTTPTTGTVTSVAATSPLASSGGATPTISIASSTGTGAVVLADSPIFNTQIYIDSPGVNDGFLKFTSVANLNYIQSGLSSAGGSTADLRFTDINAANTWMTIQSTGNVGIGTTSPGAKLDVNGTVSAQSSVTIGGAGNVGLSTVNASRSYTLGVRGDTSDVFAITDNTASAFRMVINTSGNVGIGTTSPSYKLHVEGAGYFNNNGETLILNGATHSYLQFKTGGVNRAFVGYDSHSTSLNFINQRNDGNVYIAASNPAYGVQIGNPIVLQQNVVIKIAPASSTFDFILPSSPGTAGQYLISGGAGAAMYWGAGGGGGGGTVNSVTASAPLASSGGTAPNISISSATGTGSVMLANGPTFGGEFFVDSAGSNDGFIKVASGGNINYIQSGLINTTGSAADLRFTTYNAASTLMTITASGNVGIGTTSPALKFHVVVAGGVDSARIETSANDGYASVSHKTPTQEFIHGVTATTASYVAIRDKYYWAYGGDIRLVMNTSGNIGIGTFSPATKLDVNGAITANAESKFSNGTYSDPDSGNAYIAKFGSSTGNGIAVKGNSKFTNSVIANNFTTNVTDYFSYQNVTTTFEMAIYFTGDFKVYSLTSPPAGRGTITINYLSSSNTVTYTRIGRLVTIVIGVEYNYTIPIFQTMADCKICLKLPTALMTLGTGTGGSNGTYPNYIEDAFVTSYGMRYWVQNVYENGGGLVPIIMLFRNDNSHEYLQWDNNSKNNQKVYLTTSYLLNAS